MTKINFSLEAPWTVDTSFRDKDGEVLFHAVRDKAGVIVATTFAGPREDVAHLISAAPALLAFAKAYLSVQPSIRQYQTPLEQQAIDAVKQAEGR